jgi:hypothetical protein
MRRFEIAVGDLQRAERRTAVPASPSTASSSGLDSMLGADSFTL